MSDLMLVPVPQGRVGSRDSNKPVLSVVVTPRLTGPDLAAAGMADWPTTVASAQVRVLTRPAGSVTPDATEPTATVRSTARTDVWREFTHRLTVAPFARPRGYRKPAIAQTTVDADKVRAVYTNVAAAVDIAQAAESELRNWRDAAPSPRQDQPDQRVRRDGEADFHLSVARLREHPEMLRLLGLIFDVELEQLPESAGTHEISVGWEGSPVTVVSRWTRYDFDGELFLPAAQGDVSAGLVDLTVPGRWRIVTFDVEGGVSSLRQAAHWTSEDRSRQSEGAPSSTSRGLPPLRSAGMMLTRVGREDVLAKRAADGTAAAAGSHDDKVLLAEDLVLGYRIDVRPENGDTWFSLHRRHATYAMGQVKGIVVDEEEEGHVKPHAAVIDEAGLHTDEVVARWDGWSLSLPRPRLDGRPSRKRRGSVTLPYEFDVSYAPVEASLLELEFGRAYQLRARVADLAGGGLRRKDSAADGAAAKETYARYEPVSPPRVVPPDGLVVIDDSEPGGFRIDASVVGPGGSLDRLVIRSEPASDGSFSTAAFDGDPDYPDNHARRAEAPGTTFEIAEQHGFLRHADETGVANASRAFFGGRAGEPVVDPGVTPELPDPASLGMAVAVLAQHGVLEHETHEDRPWEGDWPVRIAKNVELVAGARSSKPKVQWVTEDDRSSPDGAASPRVKVVLPPGCQVDVELSSTVLGDWIDRFALNRFLDDMPADPPPPPPGETAPSTRSATSIQNAMTRGRHQLLNAPRALTFTHAVRRPLERPRGTAEVERLAGETVARVTPTDDPVFAIHVPSTGAVDVVARWAEFGDGPDPTPSSALVTQLSLPRGSTDLPAIRLDFGDTKHRTVTFGLTAISRFRTCFASSDEEALFRLDGELEPVSVRSTARPAPPVVLSVVPAFSWIEQRGHGTVTRARLGGRLRVELARPWFVTGEGESLAVVVWPGDEVDLLNHPDLQDGGMEQVTWCNRDPIHATPAPGAVPGVPAFADFEGEHEVAVFEGGPTVHALTYPVFFHENHWYADVALPGVAAASYSPFVRLAVARFQSESLVGPDLDLRMSPVVTAELAAVMPDRTLVVRRSGAELEITLSGLGRLTDGQPNRVFASIERLDAEVASDSVDLTSFGLGDPGFPAWQRMADGTVAGGLDTALPPLPMPAGPGQFRLVVREVEELAINPSAIGVNAPSELEKRTVYVDVVDLTDL